MIRKSKIIITVILILTVGYFEFDFICKLGTKCKNFPQYSSTKEESQKSGFYVAEYEPIKKDIKLKYHHDTIQFVSAWAEKVCRKILS